MIHGRAWPLRPSDSAAVGIAQLSGSAGNAARTGPRALHEREVAVEARSKLRHGVGSCL